MRSDQISLGLYAKTGRAIAIALAGPADSPHILFRRELALSSEGIPATAQPYHEVMELPWAKALVAVKPAIRAIERLAEEALRDCIREAAANGAKIIATGIVGSMGQDPARIGNPHIRAHAAEGQLFRQVLETAAAKLGLASFVASPRDVWSKAGILLGQQDSSLRTRVHALGKGVVRPWRTVEQEATLAGWAALVVSARS